MVYGLKNNYENMLEYFISLIGVLAFLVDAIISNYLHTRNCENHRQFKIFAFSVLVNHFFLRIVYI